MKGWISSLIEYRKVYKLHPTKSNKRAYLLFQFLSVSLAIIIGLQFSCRFYSDDYHVYGCEKLDLNMGDYTFKTTDVPTNFNGNISKYTQYTLELLNPVRWEGRKDWAESCITQFKSFWLHTTDYDIYEVSEKFEISCNGISFQSKQYSTIDIFIFPSKITDLFYQEIVGMKEIEDTAVLSYFLQPTEDGKGYYYSLSYTFKNGTAGFDQHISRLTPSIFSQTMKEILIASRINLRYTCTSCYLNASNFGPSSFLKLISISFPLYRGFIFAATFLLDYMYEYKHKENFYVDEVEAIPLTNYGERPPPLM